MTKLTKAQKSVLKTLNKLGRRKYHDIFDITTERLDIEEIDVPTISYKAYDVINTKICEELTRKGYADQLNIGKHKVVGKYKITEKGQKKAKLL